jgi:hypothetical protein
MMKYNRDAIVLIPGFVDKNRLSVLKNYVLDNKSSDAKQVFLFSDIEDDEVRENMLFINAEAHHFIKNDYLKGVHGVNPIYDMWSRELELIRWHDGAELAPHYDGDKPEDALPPPIDTAKIGSLVYINDDYAGGEIGFTDYGIKIKPSPGDLVIFPYFYMHEVHLVERLDPDLPSHRITMPMFNSFVLEN